MDSTSPLPPENDETNSLEGSSTVIEPAATTPAAGEAAAGDQPPIAEAEAATSSQPETAPRGPKPGLKSFFRRFNIYLLAFVFLLIVATIVVVVVTIKGRKNAAAPTVGTQSLTQKQLEQLGNSDVNVGNSSQILNVQSNAVFGGQVLVRQNLEVAGTITAGGALNLPGITVSGTSSFSQIQTSTLNVSGNSTIQGQLTVGGGLNVSGNTTFAGAVSIGQLTINGLTLNGDLNLTHHITAGGPIPSRTAGTALGSGGTVSISGSDTAGTITINTGDSPAAGCFATVNFVTKFNATPHVVVTPIGSGAAGLAYYVNRTTTSFSVCTASAAPAGQTFGFDYIAFD